VAVFWIGGPSAAAMGLPRPEFVAMVDVSYSDFAVAAVLES
jgi:hypothetical protein